jgi:hypothetical protein
LLRKARRQQPIERRLVEKRVSPRQQDHVQAGLSHGALAHRNFIDADPEGPDHSLFAQSRQGAKAAAGGECLPMPAIVGPVRKRSDVVHVDDVDMREPQALQTVFTTAQDGIVAVIVLRTKRHRGDEAVPHRRIIPAAPGPQQPPHL